MRIRILLFSSMKAYIEGKGRFFIMIKFKEHRKAICTVAAVAVLATAGFMGLDRFVPKERSLTIVGDGSVTASKEVITEDESITENGENVNIDE